MDLKNKLEEIKAEISNIKMNFEIKENQLRHLQKELQDLTALHLQLSGKKEAIKEIMESESKESKKEPEKKQEIDKKEESKDKQDSEMKPEEQIGDANGKQESKTE